MVLMEGLFEFVNGLAADLKATVSVVVVALAIAYVVISAVTSRLSIAKIVTAGLAAGLLIAVVMGPEVISTWFTTELSGSNP